MIVHAIKNPSGRSIIGCMIILSLNSIFQIINQFNNPIHPVNNFFLSFSSLMLLVYVSVIFIAIFRARKKPTELYLHDERIQLNGLSVDAKDIKVMMIMGYFRPVIGIKPHGKKIVPLKMCFKFPEDEDKGIADLTKWAETNKVKLVKRDFIRWI
ncbi:hypothetical protein MU1_29960 [Paenibacillus glycanilyticus]|uniref:Uncharacterized protein n=1 Tax=Paenibacillus glycanilyticus TaxID=126569 RepID=A0ABQ6GH58_9BACL|nr:hypothetical protein MU1_29960 [Paenibacillus glycanilyticus]